MQRALSPIGIALFFCYSSLGCGDVANQVASGGSGPTLPAGGATSMGGASALAGSGGALGGGAGAAACAAPQMVCPGAGCVDVQSSDQNCGACGTACTADKHCSQGKCQCAMGQMACGDSCVDLMTSAQHCGTCEQACPDNGMCKAGHCVGADGCAGPAGDITVSQLVLYQTVAIPLMQDQKEVAAASRNADVVAGRDALLRVFVTPGAAWTPRELSARLHASDATGPLPDVFVKATPQGSSNESDLKTTFNLQLPKTLIKTGVKYSVELVECSDTTGVAQAPRFPTTGDAELGAKTTGPLKVHFVPLQVGDQMPDLSATRLEHYKGYLEALYPITEVTFTVGEARQVGAGEPNFDNLLDDLFAQRGQEHPEDDVYYVEMSALPSSDGSDGVGFQADPDDPDFRAAVTTSHDDAEEAAMVMAHELGHNHGLDHSPCDVDGDPNYPYDGAVIGVWGYDRRNPQELLDPKKNFDLMSYCNPAWFSDYTYEPVLKRVAHVNGADKHRSALQASTSWRVLIVQPSGAARWGHPHVGRPPSGGQEPATVLDQDGNAVATITVYRKATSSHGAAWILLPEPAPGWAAVQVRGLPAIRFE